MLWKYIHHLAREAQELPISGNNFSILLPQHFCQLTWKEFMTWRLQDSTQNLNSVSNVVYRGQYKQDSRYKSNQNPYQLLAFKKGIKREASQYTTLKDEKYFEPFKRNLLITATTHACEEVLDVDYMPGYDNDVKNCSNRSNTSCTMFSTKYSKLTWAKP